MKKIFKSTIQYLTKDMGFMALPLKWIEADKQKHGLAAYFITTTIFFLLIGQFSASEATIFKDVLFAITGMVVSTLVGHVKEVADSKIDDGVYDKKDIHIMLFASLAIGFFLDTHKTNNF